ncbi:MAG: LysM protein, partial [Candidatus Rokubacteria bacterium]|nr:LysM protein [Candidatus Rokubacteria bacterium]
MTPPRGRRAIGLGLLLPGLLLTHPGAADADSRTATSPAKKTTSKTEASVERKARSRVDAGPNRRVLGQSRGHTVHVVRAGDSVGRIAAHYGVTRKSLIEANKLARPAELRIGQRL